MTSFLNACGITGSLKLVVDGPDRDHAGIRALQQPFAIIGRDLRADVILEHFQVSRRHVYLQVIEGCAFWIDLGSRTGTRAGRRSQNIGWLEGGGRLGVGPYEIRLSISGSQNDPAARSLRPRNTPFVVRAYNQAALPEVALEFLNGPSRSMRWHVHRIMSLIGSANGCKLRLADPSVSRFHASLVRTPTGLWVVDMLGEGGVTVNSASVRFSRLEDGDVLEIGRYHMRVQFECGGRDTADPSPDSKLFSTPRPQNSAPDHIEFPESAAAAAAAVTGFAPGSGSPKGAEVPLLTRPFPPTSGFDIMPSNGAYPGKLDESDSTASMLVPLVNQFGLMQQQMFDQFQQAISMLVQMFGKMHQDQMDVIRAELDRLHELTEEFQSLKDELARRTQIHSQPDASELTNSPAVSEPSGLGRRDFLTGSSAAPLPLPRSQTAASYGPSVSSGAVFAGSGIFSPPASPAGVCGDTLSEKTQVAASSERRSEPKIPLAAPEQSQGAGPHSPHRSANSSTEADSDKDTIIWLHQRIMSIQSEREGRWQKILKLLPGVS